ncbi:SRPBCC family protein [Amycolatopsis sp.]|uniref:SRPBCC family protein n=1 Tax=Amycolatopsis sp. TaxID=37632 RepID=UPI002D0791A2|nr:SRPBCC family protein [Amycolatopsis sp.]HVV13406.1 SRPBCC family protein [Amycolatopsis sp.]
MTQTELTAVAGQPVITVTREFDAPAELVYRTYTDPALIPEWWGPDEYTTDVEVMEVRHGGRWRFVQTAEDGGQHAFHGVYHDAVPGERIVQTFEYEGAPGHVLLETMRFTDLGGRTRVTGTSVFQSLEDRDGMIAAGMEAGAVRSYERMAELLVKVPVD